MLSNKARHIITWEGNMTTLDRLQQLARLEKRQAKYVQDVSRLSVAEIDKKYNKRHEIWTIDHKVAFMKRDLDLA